jgi:hypothetical protein
MQDAPEVLKMFITEHAELTEDESKAQLGLSPLWISAVRVVDPLWCERQRA